MLLITLKEDERKQEYVEEKTINYDGQCMHDINCRFNLCMLMKKIRQNKYILQPSPLPTHTQYLSL